MVRFTTAIAIILVICLGCVGLTYILARSTPQLPPLDWLTLGQCKLPCWRTIIPGETSFLDAERILRAQPDLYFNIEDESREGSNYFALNFLLRAPNGYVRGVMTSVLNGTRVQYIYLYPRMEGGQDTLSLVDVIQLAGVPHSVMTDANAGSLVRFHYDGFEAINYPWTIFQPGSDCTSRLSAATGLLIGTYLGFQPWESWVGFDRRFDTWCREAR